MESPQLPMRCSGFREASVESPISIRFPASDATAIASAAIPATVMRTALRRDVEIKVVRLVLFMWMFAFLVSFVKQGRHYTMYVVVKGNEKNNF
jgi:hypothetical protein